MSSDNLKETGEKVQELLEKYHRHYAFLSERHIALWDRESLINRVHIEILPDGNISYAGIVIGGLDELEKRL